MSKQHPLIPSTNESLHCFFYRSQLAPDCHISCVADIIKTARNLNKAQDITGVLIFDGQQFCQYIEGPQPALQQLIDRIANDKRHVMFSAMYQSSGFNQRRFQHWAMAYVVMADEDEPLSPLTKLHGPYALERLQALLPQLDIA